MICLDSWAVIAWVRGDQPAASRVQAIIHQRPIISTVNIAEVFYVIKRSTDELTARNLIRDLRAKTKFINVDEKIALIAGNIKADNALALADAIALATASVHGATLITGDPEIFRSKGKWKVRDIR